MTTVPPLDRSREAEFRALVDGKAKPPGALGRIEDLAVRLALIAGRPDPSFPRARLLVFAGDHGLNQAGVSAYPSAVTAAMVATLLAGRASANAFAQAAGAEVQVVDAGVDADLPVALAGQGPAFPRPIRRSSQPRSARGRATPPPNPP